MEQANVIQQKITLVAFKATNVFLQTKSNPTAEESIPKFDLKLEDSTVQDNPKWFVKIFFIDIVSLSKNEDGSFDEMTSCKVEYHTVFATDSDINQDFLRSDFAKISAPAIGFPYLRAFISNLSLQSGIPIMILPSINFIQLAALDREQKKL